MWAVQFHPEVHHTPLGPQLIRNFVFNICGAKGDWTPAHFIETTVAGIREKVGKGANATYEDVIAENVPPVTVPTTVVEGTISGKRPTSSSDASISGADQSTAPWS